MTPVNCSKTQSVTVETLMNHDKEARRIPPAENPEKSATREHPESGPTMDHQHAKVERFLKLGYSHSDIVRVLESLRHDAQTNDILEELIKTCHSRSHGNHSMPDSPKLVARGCSPNGGQPRAAPDRESAGGFRPVVIDGSNVAMSHGDKKVFSCQGIQLAVNWFWDKGLRDITVFIPLWRKEPRPDALITDQHILHELERRKILVYTPSRSVNGKRVVCYDDRYIVKLAVDSDGIIVSNDNYRDLQTENPKWKKFIEERLLMYTFANDKFMPPDDPLGRNGPTIEDFLRKKLWTPDNKLQHCPYGKKCTYGVKCKFYHPERVNQSQLSVADELRALSDRAKSFSPKEPHHALHTSTPPPLGVNDQSHRASPSQRDTGSPRSQSSTGHHHWPSLDMDEAFSSMESSLSRLYIQEAPYSVERPTHSYSSGVASYSLGHDSYSLSSSFNGYNPHQQNGPVPGECPTCSGCRCQQTRMSSHHHHHPTWGSCPALLPLTKGSYSDKQCFGPPHARQSHSLPRDPWLHGCRSDGRSTGSTKSLPSEQRNSLRSQLSALFPQSTVEHLMNTYPHVSDMSELMALIQNNWTSCMTF